ncbi:hypothetical protein PHET_11190 [Paragonimus heterotremus]|uniref:Uncharacterized protein n=1 Tax=Paragonimus heterotremus TaxID=100268 RepID=A0A8J4T1B6_9TREM|nr:hypothetical protein PHET_11190 [Paragonimus heterotremus]
MFWLPPLETPLNQYDVCLNSEGRLEFPSTFVLSGGCRAVVLKVISSPPP